MSAETGLKTQTKGSWIRMHSRKGYKHELIMKILRGSHSEPGLVSFDSHVNSMQ